MALNTVVTEGSILDSERGAMIFFLIIKVTPNYTVYRKMAVFFTTMSMHIKTKNYMVF